MADMGTWNRLIVAVGGEEGEGEGGKKRDGLVQEHI